MRKFLMLAILGGYTVGCFAQKQMPGALDLCTVATNIKTYSGQQVRVTTFMGVGGEQSVLFDPKCQEGKPLVYVSFKTQVTGKMAALREILGKKHYALVTLEGTMHGMEPVKLDPKLPDWIKERYKGSSTRYGHLGSLEMMIEVEKVIEAKEVDDESMPSTVPSTK
jgi:hypothetical protein